MTQTSQPFSKALVFIFITILIDVMGIGLVIPVFPKLIETYVTTSAQVKPAQLQAKPSTATPTPATQAAETQTQKQASKLLGVLTSIYALMQFVFAPLFGALSDRYGRRPILLGSMLGTGIDYLIFAASPWLWLLFVARTISGVLGANITTANAYIADVTPEQDRARVFGFTGAIFGMGFIVGPLLGGWLGTYNLHWPLYFAAILCLANALFGWFVLPESLPKERRSVKPFSLNPFKGLDILRSTPTLLSLSAFSVLSNAAFQMLQVVWIMYTQQRYGWDTLYASSSLVLVGVLSVVTQATLTPKLVALWGERKALVFSAWIGAITFALYGLASQPWMMFAAIIFGSLGNVGQPALQALSTQQASSEQQGTLQGALASMISAVGVVAPLLGTWLYGSTLGVNSWSIGVIFFVSSALYLIGAAVLGNTFKRHAA